MPVVTKGKLFRKKIPYPPPKYEIQKLSEKQIQNQIWDLLRYEGYLVWRNNSGGRTETYTDKNGRTKKRYVSFGGIDGASDIFAIQPNTGRFVAIEVKTPQTMNNVSRDQQAFIDLVNFHGGIGMVAWDYIMVANALNIKITVY